MGYCLMRNLNVRSLREDMEEFKEKTDAFYAGEMDKGAYKADRKSVV